MTARERIERAFHVSFKLPEQAAELLDDYRREIRDEVAQEIDERANDGSDWCLDMTAIDIADWIREDKK